MSWAGLHHTPKIAGLLVAALVLTLTTAAWGQIRQSDPMQTIIPVIVDPGDTNCCEVQDIFNDRGEMIDAIGDASLVPEVFTPSAELTFQLVAEGGLFENLFGWYNLGDDVTDPANRHIIFGCDDEPLVSWALDPGPPVNAEKTVTFCGNPDWKGGPIGFFVITPQIVTETPCTDVFTCPFRPNYCATNVSGTYIYYTEPRLNIQEQSFAEPYIHHLVHRSTATPDTFYFGFEDLFRGGDNDFEDMLIQVSGLLVGGPTELCDGMDNDCDSEIDESVTEACTTTCGTGVRLCVGGDFGACSVPEPTDEVCDGEDNDCDGEIDEGLTRACNNACGLGVEVCAAGEFVGCSAPEAGPEACDNVDNNCNGVVDEGLSRSCNNGCQGRDGVETCVAGRFAGCDAPRPATEICDGEDNDCDGDVDEGITRGCRNACGTGTETCVDGEFVGCDAPDPGVEVCNGRDDNCNGVADEGLTQSCSTACGEGVVTCIGGEFVGCSAPEPSMEICDNIDNDCDGEIDEALSRDCSNDCGGGTQTCEAGRWVGCSARQPEVEICDGINNDCDGQVDEGITRGCQNACGTGTETCVDGEFMGCNAPGPSEEVCDGRDNDCNGLTDEGLTRSCETMCGSGVEFCRGGSFVGCTAPGSSGEMCDNLDNDCDGMVDEGLTRGCSSQCGDGEEMCQAGNWVGCDAALPVLEICDNLDNDCDGDIDEELTRGCVNQCGTGTETCVEGEFVGCDAPEPGVEVCNGRDENCNGLADEGLSRACETACGVGVEFCRSGGFVGCTARQPEDEICDNLDNDCDGEVDEGLARDCTSACGGGEEVCEAGQWLNCTAPQPELEECDGEDNDCDGEVDEELDRVCAGACGSGTQRCEDGTYSECVTPEPTDEICDGLDNDCDNGVDEGLFRDCSSACGSGVESCRAGQWINCTAPAPRPEVCDAIDNDCDGEADEELERECASECGTAIQTCSVGDWGECSVPEAETEVCDGNDNDCDGVVDNNVDCPGTAECINGDCREECQDGECPRGLICTDGFCLPEPCAECNSCEVCVAGECMDPCAGVDCGENGLCLNGECFEGTCYELGCNSCEVCTGGECIPNDCLGVVCPGDQLCRLGVCEPTCLDIDCPGGQRCVSGSCVDDPCAEVSCPAEGEVCAEGVCVDDPCEEVECGDGFTCVGGDCAEDPCLTVVCPPASVCVVTLEGNPDCLDQDMSSVDDDDPLNDALEATISGSGCACQTPAAPNSGRAPWGALLLVTLGGALVWLRRRRDDARVSVKASSGWLVMLALALLTVNGCAGCDDEAGGANVDTSGDSVCASAEVCDGEDNDCDGEVDNVPLVTLNSDAENCGACGAACDFPNALPVCIGGECRITSCEPGWGNIDGVLSNGCETPCEPSNGGVEACDDLDNDCDGQVDEGFNVNNDVLNCGECGRVCDLANANDVNCLSGRCVVLACDEGYLNLNNDAADGCEYACEVTNNGVEICDGLDNDCNGLIDEEVGLPPIQCRADGVCRGLRAVCRGAEGWVCPYPEVYNADGEVLCDSLDDDCDGEIDEDFADLGSRCDGEDDDLCTTGLVVCAEDGDGTVCQGDAPKFEACDGLDNDCDGDVDEDFDLTSDAANCGRCGNSCTANNVEGMCEEGRCVITGCEEGSYDLNGNPVDGCEYLCTPSGDEVCDGADNDCDGAFDEGVVPTETCLAEGVCENIRPRCMGAMGFVCPYPPSHEPNQEMRCDGLDNDCDGMVDESFADLNQPCDGDDADQCADGVLLCNADGDGTRCSDDDDSSAERCDGFDNDCDGLVDEDFDLTGDANNCGACGVRCELDNAVGFCEDSFCAIERCVGDFTDRNGSPVDGCEYACTPTNGGVEICDGLDNNCDGLVDNGVQLPTDLCLNQGVCRSVRPTCLGAEGLRCLYPDNYEEDDEQLCDGFDNDCDGEIDEGYPTLGTPCDGGDADSCQDGVIVCGDDGESVVCSDDEQSGEELCDGFDNDCDGEIDETFDLTSDVSNCGVCNRVCNLANTAATCEESRCVGQGCAMNYYDINENPVDGCEYRCQPSAPGAELCDGEDNDCDGQVDEGLAGTGPACLSDGVCRGVRSVCLGAEGFRCLYPDSYEEGEEQSCDRADNDCDGRVDEVFAGLGQVCDGDDADLCTNGIRQCAPDGVGTICTDDATSIDEVCDGLDNDCDDGIDEAFDLTSDVDNCGRCGSRCAPANAEGACDESACVIVECEAGFYDLNETPVDGCEYACTPTNGGVEICDGLDNDCDGEVDDNPTDDPDNCRGPGVCTGLRPACVEGGWTCFFPSTYQMAETRCDNLDNDCDGMVDEATDNPALAGKGQACSDGLGACRRPGVRVCDAMGTGLRCTAEAADVSTTELCDNLDNDCDGMVDEELPTEMEMVQISGPEGAFFIDIYEASRPDATSTSAGFNTSYSCSRPGVMPWNQVSYAQAEAACAARGKRLCTDDEWSAACGGEVGMTYPYGASYDAGVCNTESGSPTPTGSFPACVTAQGLFDMSGNLAEWTDCADPNDCNIVRGLYGGSYLDSFELLLSCGFRNNASPQTANGPIGFRCCL